MDKFFISQSKVPHKLTKKTTDVTTIVKKDSSRIYTNDIKKMADNIIQKHPNKRLMIKVLSEAGYFTLKHFDAPNNVIIDDEDYFNGREDIDVKRGFIYKVSFYMM